MNYFLPKKSVQKLNWKCRKPCHQVGDLFRTEPIIICLIKLSALEFYVIQLICCIHMLGQVSELALIPSLKNNVEFFPPPMSYNSFAPGSYW